MSKTLPNNRIATQEDCSKGGKARAVSMTPKRRSEIARIASHSRANLKNLPQAKHTGKFHIGEISINCAVLEDGKRVITQKTFNETLGRKGKSASIQGSDTSLFIPNFLSANNLLNYLDKETKEVLTPVKFLSKNKGLAYGFDSILLPKICEIYLKARADGKLTAQQLPIADRCEILVRSLAKVGISALIDEATGYQEFREKDELQLLFSKFIAKELQPWVKRFPDEFFFQLKRMYGLEKMKKTPRFFGHLINKWVYQEISPEVLEELKRVNPLDEGTRKVRHHQYLTDNVGCPTLQKQIVKVTTLMTVSDSKEEFEKLLEKSRN